MTSFKLNPLAKPFVPSTVAFSQQEGSTSNKYHQRFGIHNTSHPVELQNCSTLEVADLPPEVICCILQSLPSVKDVISSGLTCKLLLDLLDEAALSLDLSTSITSTQTAAEVVAHLTDVLKTVTSRMHGVRELSLRNQPVDDTAVFALLAKLHHLRVLDLSGCKKITHNLAQKVFLGLSKPGTDTSSSPSNSQPGQSSGTPSSKLLILNIQRCFQLTSASLSQLLHAVALDKLPLRCLAMSHLEFEGWPFSLNKTAAAMFGAPRGQNNSFLPRLEDAAAAVVATGPSSVAARESGTRPACHDSQHCLHTAAGLQVLVLNNCAHLSCEALLGLATAVPDMQYLLLGGSQVAAPMEQPQLDLPPKLMQLLEQLQRLVDQVYIRPIGISTQSAMRTRHNACQLALAALLLPNLRAIELTFMPQLLVETVRKVLSLYCKSTGRPRIQVWDFSTSGSVAAAVSSLAQARQQQCGAGHALAGACFAGTQIMPGFRELQMGIVCAVNCSAPNRSTPLHYAAERGDPRCVQQLLELGAQPDTRDASGCTPLFVACEARSGLTAHSAIVSTLLSHGAAGTAANSSGESPLYIASLKGHQSVVAELLQHFKQQNIRWQDPSLYGDSWTPLMAAAVANRHDVAATLLQAAGSQAKQLVRAVNKGGQSVLHIAARKGSQKLLRLLLQYDGRSTLCVEDRDGHTPMDVAKRNRHIVALAEFRRVVASA